MNRMKRSGLLLLIVVGTLLFSACGGGSDNPTSPAIDPMIVSAISPADGATDVAVNTAVTITFNNAIDCSTVTNAGITLNADGVNEPGSLVCSGSSVTFTPTAELFPFTEYTLNIGASVADTGVDYLSSFTTGNLGDSAAPMATTLIPADNSIDIAVDAIVRVDFNEPLDGTTVTTTTYNLFDGIGNSVTGTVAYNAMDNSATFAPTVQLSAGSAYTVTVSAAVTDLANNPMGTDFSWEFTTGADMVSPSIIAVDPLDGDPGASVGNQVSVTFDDHLNPATVVAANFSLVDSSGTPVVCSPSYNSAISVATFNPVALDNNEIYTATVAASVADLDGNAMGQDVVWSFTAIRPLMTGAPTFAVASAFSGSQVEVTVPVSANAYNISVELYDESQNLAGLADVYNTEGATSVTVKIATNASVNGNIYPRVVVWDLGYLSRTYYSRYAFVSDINYGMVTKAWSDSSIVIPYISLVLMPDLTVSIDTLTEDGANLTVDYTISNVGGADATASMVDFFVDPVTAPVLGEVGEQSAAVPALAAGASVSASMTIPISDTTGVVYALIDSELIIDEVNEEVNNYAIFVQGPYVGDSPDSYEPDNTPAQASLYSKPQLHSHYEDVTDWVIFSAEASKSYIIQTFNMDTAADTDTYLYLYDTDGVTLIAENDDIVRGVVRNSRIVWTPAVSGDYYVKGGSWDDYFGPGREYTLAIIAQ